MRSGDYAAQLCGLTFRPAADAVGQISLLRYRSCDQAFAGEVLLIVGPDHAFSRSMEETDTAGDSNSVAPVAAALLLQAGLSSLSSTAASAAVDSDEVLSADPPLPTNVAGTAPQISDQGAAAVLLARSAPAETGTSSSTLANTDPLDEPSHHHIGSSSPPDFVNLKLALPSLNTALSMTTISAITPTSVTPSAVPLSSSSLLNQGSVAGLTPASTMQAPESGPLNQEHISAPGQGNASGTGSFEIADKAVLEIKGAVSGQLTNGSFYGTTVTFDTGNGELILDHSAQFNGLIASALGTLTPNNLIDLRDLAFTSSMSASVHYDGASNISSVNFSNGSANVTLLFSGSDSNWTFTSDGNGGTIVADPNAIVLENQKPGTPQSVWQVDPGQDFDQA